MQYVLTYTLSGYEPGSDEPLFVWPNIADVLPSRPGKNVTIISPHRTHYTVIGVRVVSTAGDWHVDVKRG